MNVSLLSWASVFLAAVCVAKARAGEKLSLWDALFLLTAWEPFNFGLWQRALSRYTGHPYELADLLLIGLAFAYAKRRRIRVGFRLGAADLRCWLKHLALLLPLIPLGLGVGFLRFRPDLRPRFVIGRALDYYVFVAVGEELIFRGLLQNLLERRMGRWPAIVTTAALFAFAFSHVTGNGVFPNWTYVGFAFLCGLAYGHSYTQSRSLAVPVLVHGSVDFLWRVLLS